MKTDVFENAVTIRKILEKKPQYRECLFSRGYLITEDDSIDPDAYPFYGQWRTAKLGGYTLFLHRDQDHCVLEDGGVCVLIVGHAYDPFADEYEEEKLLARAAAAYRDSREGFFRCINDWTGIFCVFVFDRETIAVQDCAGIKALYYGAPGGKVCYTSHPQLVADLYGLEMDPFIRRLVRNRFYHIGNRYLPGDCSPFAELKRIGANVYLEHRDSGFAVRRFYPTKPLDLCTTGEECERRIAQSHEILHKNLELISKKWNRCAISLSGGTDSKTTLACANGLYDRFDYFSFQSKESEVVDSEAARRICDRIGLKHDIYPIPAENSQIEDFEELKKIIVHSYGYVRGLSDSEIRKHITMYRWDKFDTEVKSWISEVVRVFFARKYGTEFPKKLSPRHFSIFQTRYFASPRLLAESDRIYRAYMEKFDLREPAFNYEHTDLYYWEVRMSSWGMMVTQSLDLCHRITFPFNNRRLVELMLTLPREYRKNDMAHNDIIALANRQIADADIHVLNNYFHSNRILLENLYFKYRTLFIR